MPCNFCKYYITTIPGLSGIASVTIHVNHLSIQYQSTYIISTNAYKEQKGNSKMASQPRSKVNYEGSGILDHI